MGVVEQKVTFEIVPPKPGNYCLLVFTQLSKFTVNITKHVTTVSRLLKIVQGGYITVQLFEKLATGLQGRHSQYLIGATTLSVEAAHGHLREQPFALSLHSYYQAEAQQVAARCSLLTARFRIVPFKERLKDYRNHGHPSQRKYTPASKFIRNVSMPYYFDESTQSLLPGGVFFRSPPFAVASTEQEWISHFRKLLVRFRKTGNISSKTIEEVVGDLLPAIYLIADAITEVVTCYPYRPDRGESFDDVFFNRGGDCEDFAKGMLRAWAALQRTCVHATTPFMCSVGKVIGDYQAWAVLGSVKKRSFSTSDGVTGVAAHMYAMLLPRGLFVEVGKRSNLARVVLEGTARVSYLAGAVGLAQCQPRPPCYRLQPMSTDATELGRFYFRASFVFTSEQQHRNPEFLVVNESQGEYGVSVSDILSTGPPSFNIRFLPGPRFEPKVEKYIGSTYLQVQGQFQKATEAKLPLFYSMESVIFEQPGGAGKTHSICFRDADMESYADYIEAAKAMGALELTREDKTSIRIKLPI